MIETVVPLLSLRHRADCPMRWGSSNMPSWTVHGWNAATAPTTPGDCSPSHPGLLGIPKRPSWPRSPCFLERAHLGGGPVPFAAGC